MNKTNQKLNQKVNLIVETLVSNVDKFFPKLINTKEWQDLEEEEKRRVKRDLFYIQYGKSVEEYKIILFNNLKK